MWKSIILLFVIFIIVTEQSGYETSLCKLKELKIIYNNNAACYTGYFIGDLIDKKNVILESNIIIYKSNINDNCYGIKSYVENWEFDYDFNETFICYYSIEHNNAYLIYINDNIIYFFFGLIILILSAIIIYNVKMYIDNNKINNFKDIKKLKYVDENTYFNLKND